MAPNGADGRDARLQSGGNLKKYGLPIVAVGAVAAGVAWALPSFLCLGDNCYTIQADPVTAGPDGKVAGSLTLKKAAVNAIHTDRKVGACLLADYGIFNLPPINTPDGKCTTDADCGGTILKSPPFPPAFAGWESTCHVPSGTCWVRPGKGALQTDVCNKGITAVKNVPVPSNFLPFDLAKLKDPATVRPGTAKVKMRILACLNGIYTPGTTPPCAGSTNNIKKFSDVTEFDIPG